jgi:sec-independent protein translocase protein TatA
LEERKMGALSLAHWLVVLLVVVIVLGAGKFPRLMHDLGEGIKNFKASLGDAGGSQVSVVTDASPDDRNPADGW